MNFKESFIFIMISILVFGLLSFCTDEQSARKVLEESGYTDIEFTGYDYFNCGRNEFTSTGFKAKSFNGKDVVGTVCEGIWLSPSIRINN